MKKRLKTIAKVIGIMVTLMTSILHAAELNLNLPEYVVFEVGGIMPTVLKTPAYALTFPLTNADYQDIQILEKKYDSEENCAGLAAPQIGISKQIIIFEVPTDAELKKWRPDCIQSMSKTIWINPSYEGIETMGTHEDYEGCFSVKDVAGPVIRYKKINYKAYDINGTLITGQAEGFLARVIQHEIDHIQGTLCIDRMPTDKIISIEAYRKRRKAAMEQNP
jgi:peptide deformylase